MKKFIFLIIFFILFIFVLPAWSVTFLPKYSTCIKNYGIGLYFGEGKETVYELPDEKSKVLAVMNWDANNVFINDKTFSPKDIFIVFLPAKSLSGFIALDEQGSEYTKIIYNTKTQQSGWIKNSPDNKVFYWRRLFYQYGRNQGLYFFADMLKENKVLKLAPEDTAEISYTFIYPKYIRLQLIKGNWALLKVVDFDNEQKVGWYKWRNSDGTLNIFPAFNS